MNIILSAELYEISNSMTTLKRHDFFPSPVYIVDAPEFLPAVQVVANEYLKDIKAAKTDFDPLYPVQTDGFFHEPVLAEFTQYIAQTAWTILRDQGFDMTDRGTYFREMWAQEHNQYQGHDEHIHTHGDQISGFYFFDAPEGASTVAIHDPRPGKLQINLEETEKAVVTDASASAVFLPKPGQMFFINSWLPHSVTRNPTANPTRLVHFNLTVGPAPKTVGNAAPEVKQATVI